MSFFLWANLFLFSIGCAPKTSKSYTAQVKYHSQKHTKIRGKQISVGFYFHLYFKIWNISSICGVNRKRVHIHCFFSTVTVSISSAFGLVSLEFCACIELCSCTIKCLKSKNCVSLEWKIHACESVCARMHLCCAIRCITHWNSIYNLFANEQVTIFVKFIVNWVFFLDR